MSKSDTKGFQRTGRMNENLGIMRLCFDRMSATQAFVSDLDIHGSFRAPALVPSGPRWGRHRQTGPGQLGQSAAQAGACQAPGQTATLLRRSIRCACGHVPGLELLARRVMPGQPQVASVLRVLLRDRGQAGAGLIEPGLAALGQGLAALPQRQGVLQGDRARLKTLYDGHQLLAGPLIAERGDVLIGAGRPAGGRGGRR